MKNIFYLFTVLAQVTIVSGYAAPPGDIVIHVKKIRNTRGMILVALHATPSNFPGTGTNAFRLERGTIANGGSEIIIRDVPKGNYAIALFHDENNDQKLNTNFLGIPKEGYGFSNNAYHTFRAPDFREASFQHDDNTTVNIHMHY